MRKTLFALALFMALPAGAQPRPFFDLDFEASRCTAPWHEDYAPGFERVWDGGTAHSGRQSLRIRYTGGATTAEEIGFSGLLQEFPLADVLGKRVRLDSWIRTEGIAVGSAELYMSARRAHDRDRRRTPGRGADPHRSAVDAAGGLLAAPAGDPVQDGADRQRLRRPPASEAGDRQCPHRRAGRADARHPGVLPDEAPARRVPGDRDGLHPLRHRGQHARGLPGQTATC